MTIFFFNFATAHHHSWFYIKQSRSDYIVDFQVEFKGKYYL